jgi:V8-like Glu-specific endopeptidase
MWIVRRRSFGVCLATLAFIASVAVQRSAVAQTNAHSVHDPVTSRPPESQSPYAQPPAASRGATPIVPPPPRAVPTAANPVDAVEYEVGTHAVRLLPAPSASPESARSSMVQPYEGLLAPGDVQEWIQPESILGTDGRIRVTPTTAFPWRTIVDIFVTFPGQSGWCTGALIDAFHVYTAGHCVHNGFSYFTSMQVFPGRDGTFLPFHFALVTNVRTYTGWTQDQEVEQDWAVVTLDRNVGNFTGWMGRVTSFCFWPYVSGSSCDSRYFGEWNNAGYPDVAPDGTPGDDRLYFDADNGQRADEFKQWYYMDTRAGNSGGPVWYSDGTNRYIGAIHAYANDDGSGANHGTRLNQDKYDRTNTWLAEDTPPVDRSDLFDDGLAMFYGTPGSLVRGETLISVGSDVRNNGTATASGFTNRYVLSADTSITASDYMVCEAQIAVLSPFTWANSDCTGIVPPAVPAGNYYLGVIYDVYGSETEFDESNNTAVLGLVYPVRDPATPGTLQMSAASYTVSEAGAALTVTVTRTNGNAGTVGATLSTGTGTALAGSDYTALTQAVSFGNGDTAAKMVTIPILEDTLVEGIETFTVSLGAPTGGALLGATTSATVTITDNDVAPPGTLQFSGATFSVGESAGGAVVTITRTGGSAGVLAASVVPANGTAAAGNDFAGATLGVAFSNGDTAPKTVTIPILSDTIVEGNETVNLALTGSAIGSPATAMLTIVDDDTAGPHRILVTAPASGSANPSAPGAPVTLSVGVLDTQGHTLSYLWQSTCAEVSGSGTFTPKANVASPTWTPPAAPPGTALTCLLRVTVVDNVDQNVTSSFMQKVTTGTSTPPGTLQLTAATYSVGEAGSTLTVSVTRAGGSAGAVGATFKTSNGTASSGSDYSPVTQTVNFANGDTAAKLVTIPILEDTLVEGGETFTVTLSAPTGGATLGAPSGATVTITDNDVAASPGKLQFSAVNYSAGESAGGAVVTVTRTGGSFGVLTASVVPSGGSAAAGSDYTSATLGVAFASGDTAPKTVTVPILSDTLVEGNETVNLTLTGSAIGSPATAVLTIVDDDSAIGGPHRILVTAPASGSPNPSGRGAPVSLSVGVSDTQGHNLSYLWQATCADVSGSGTFTPKANVANPIWTPPAAPPGTALTCLLRVTVVDNVDQNVSSSFVQRVTN